MCSSITKVKNMNNNKIIYILPAFFILIISLLIAIFTIYDLEKQLGKEYQRGYENGEINTENKMFDDWLDFYEEYYELYVDYKVLEERLEWLSPDTVVHKFDKNYNFYLLVIVSRTKVNDDICEDENKWLKFVAMPLDLIQSPAHPWYAGYEISVEKNIDYWIETLREDGTWQYKESWDTSTPPLCKIASNWAGYEAVKKVFLMKKFGAVDFI